MKWITTETITKTLKITLGAILAISIAALLGLKYNTTAGIITILSIQGTKRETLQTALGRTLAFLCALILSFIFYHTFGFTILAFGIYLLFFSFLCTAAGWTAAIAMDSVLITHFLTEGNMQISLLINEILIFAIGTIIGILLNLHLHPKQEIWQARVSEADESIRAILTRMAIRVRSVDKSDYNNACFTPLKQLLSEARTVALTNIDNSLSSPSWYELDYVEMRQSQCQVLEHIYRSICMITFLPSQANTVASFFERISQQYNKENDVKELLSDLHTLLLSMKEEPLPIHREEFESRAILFYMLKQLEEFLVLKHNFVIRYPHAK